MKISTRSFTAIFSVSLFLANACGFKSENSESRITEIESRSADESVLNEKFAVRVNLQTNIATFYQYGVAVRAWQIASARNDGQSETPTGTFRFHELSVCQRWTSTRDNSSSGPCAADNPTGDFGLWFQTAEYGLHGVKGEKGMHSVTTPNAEERRASSGCVRNSPADIRWLADQVAGEYGTSAAELTRLQAQGEEVILPAIGRGVPVIVGYWSAARDGSLKGTEAPQACTKENATGRILSSTSIKVTGDQGKDFDAQPFEEFCPTSEVKNGRTRLFFPNPPAGFAWADNAKVGYCNLPALNVCIKNNGGLAACTMRECKPK